MVGDMSVQIANREAQDGIGLVERIWIMKEQTVVQESYFNNNNMSNNGKQLL